MDEALATLCYTRYGQNESDKMTHNNAVRLAAAVTPMTAMMGMITSRERAIWTSARVTAAAIEMAKWSRMTSGIRFKTDRNPD